MTTGPDPCTAEEAASALRPADTLAVGLGPAQPMAFLRALGARDDWSDLRVFGALLSDLFAVFAKPGVHLRSGFFGPVERALRAAGHDVVFVPADFRRFAQIAEEGAARVVATSAAEPDAKGKLSLSLHAGATVDELHRAARDPERLLVVETSPAYPRTLGLSPDHPHALDLSEVDVWIRSDATPRELPEPPPGAVDEAIAEQVAPYIPEGATIQTGIGGVPNAVVKLLAEGDRGDFGIHSEMFTTGLMHLHEAGKVSNRKGVFDGHSIATFAMGSRELYDWLDGREEVRFLPVDIVNDPAVIARNRQLISLNGALSVDLFGQVVADNRDGAQFSGIGGHEDFLAGAGRTAAARSLLCLPSTGGRDANRQSRIVGELAPGTIVTSPRHQVDVVVTEYGRAELAGRSVEERALLLAQIAHPDWRDELVGFAESLRSRGVSAQ
jgi:acyl-CoA hydrolase